MWAGRLGVSVHVPHCIDSIDIDKLRFIELIVNRAETMDRFLEMQSFNTVVEAGSFVAAADALNLSKRSEEHTSELQSH